MGAVTIDITANATRLQANFDMCSEEGVRSFLEKLYILNEAKYTTGNYDIAIWIIDLIDAINKAGISEAERNVIYLLYFRGYKQVEISKMLGIQKNTVNTLLKRAILKIVKYNKMIEGGLYDSNSRTAD